MLVVIGMTSLRGMLWLQMGCPAGSFAYPNRYVHAGPESNPLDSDPISRIAIKLPEP